MNMVSMVSLKQMGVYIECDADTTMTKLLLDVFNVGSLLNKETRIGMATIMKSDTPNLCPIQAGVERFLQHFDRHPVTIGSQKDPFLHPLR